MSPRQFDTADLLPSHRAFKPSICIEQDVPNCRGSAWKIWKIGESAFFCQREGEMVSRYGVISTEILMNCSAPDVPPCTTRIRHISSRMNNRGVTCFPHLLDYRSRYLGERRCVTLLDVTLSPLVTIKWYRNESRGRSLMNVISLGSLDSQNINCENCFKLCGEGNCALLSQI